MTPVFLSPLESATPVLRSNWRRIPEEFGTSMRLVCQVDPRIWAKHIRDKNIELLDQANALANADKEHINDECKIEAVHDAGACRKNRCATVAAGGDVGRCPAG